MMDLFHWIFQFSRFVRFVVIFISEDFSDCFLDLSNGVCHFFLDRILNELYLILLFFLSMIINICFENSYLCFHQRQWLFYFIQWIIAKSYLGDLIFLPLLEFWIQLNMKQFIVSVHFLLFCFQDWLLFFLHLIN